MVVDVEDKVLTKKQWISILLLLHKMTTKCFWIKNKLEVVEMDNVVVCEVVVTREEEEMVIIATTRININDVLK